MEQSKRESAPRATRPERRKAPVVIPPSPFGPIYLYNNYSTLYDVMYNITQRRKSPTL